MGTKGSNTTTSTTAPSPQAQQAYDSLLTRASGVASTPYNPYGGELVAGVNNQQTAGINNINQNAGFAQPYIQQAGTYANAAAQPLTAAQIQQYQNPYTQNVVNATQAQFNQNNAVQQSGLKANEVSQGALGGSRNADASALLANQQTQAEAPTIAGLYSQSYNSGVQTAEQQQQNQANAAYSLGNLGVAGQNAALSGAGAQVGAGSLQQGTQQALDTAQLQQFQTAQAFPYQQTQWLAGIDTGVGSQLGGTSTTTPPQPNALAQGLGLGISALGLFANRGGRIQGFDSGGAAGMPYAGVGWIPGLSITGGHGAPNAPNVPQQTNPFASAQQGLGSMKGKFAPDSQGVSTDPAGAGFPMEGSADANSLPSYAPMAFALPESAGIGMAARGGGIAGFASGGQPMDIRSPQQKTYQQWWGKYGPAESWSDGDGATIYPWSGGNVVGPDGRLNFNEVGNARPPNLGAAPPPMPTGALYARGGIAGFADGGGPSFDDRWSAMGALTPDTMTPAISGLVPTPLPRPTVGYSGSDGAPIDATDINLNAGVGGVGLGANYQPTNSAIMADSGINPGVPRMSGLASPMPSGGPTGTSYAPSGSAPSYTPLGPSMSGSAPQSTSGYGGFGLGLISPAAKAGLLAAGLGMLASRSPNLGQAIGEGGLQGLGAYNQNVQQQFAQGQKQQETALEGRKVDLEAQRLAQSADQAAKELKLKTQQFGYLPGTDGNLQPIPGGPADPSTLRAQAMAKRVPGMDDDALHMMVQSYRAGNTGVLQGISRGVSGPDNLNRFWNMLSTDMQGEGATGGDLAAAKANFGAQSAAARNAAQRESTVATAVNEAKGTFPLALQRSEEVPRSSFVPWNKAVQMVQSGTSSPELARFVTANQAVITAYSQAMSRTGTNSVNAQQHAEALLSTATSPEAYRAVIEQMGQEMEIAQAAPEQTRKDILSRIVGGTKPQGVGAAQGAPVVPAQPTVPAGAIAHLQANPQLRADFDAKYGAGASAQYLGAP